MNAYPPLIHANMHTHELDAQNGKNSQHFQRPQYFVCVHPKEVITQYKVHYTMGQKHA